MYRAILTSERAGGVVVRAMDHFSQATRVVVEVVRPELSASERDLHAAAIGGIVLGLVMHNLRTDDQRSAPELAREMVSVLPALTHPSSS